MFTTAYHAKSINVKFEFIDKKSNDQISFFKANQFRT